MIRALLVATLALSVSCDVNKYCINCGVLNGDGGTDDALDAFVDPFDAPDASTCVPTGAEACNNKDDDCDGNVDEGSLAAPVGQLCADIGGVSGPAVGECAGGVNTCVNGSVVCSKPPRPEQCDGLDNDCNGLQDEGDPGGGAKCGTDVGECVAGTFHCNTTIPAVECQGAIGTVGGQAETCNNRDDDCDGMFDEMLMTTPCVAGIDGPAQGNTGECNLGMRSCIGGVTVCSGAVFPTFEQCDVADLDQDCDGMGHNGYDIVNGDPRNCGACGTVCNLPRAFEGCANGMCTVVACETGYRNLDGMAFNGCESGFCIPTGNEICNGLDDDCSGVPDDNLGTPPNICRSGGECGATAPTAMCMGAQGWRCVYPGMVQQDPMTGAVLPETRCDTFDNDCDGAVDEGQPNKGQPCADTGIGACQGTGSYRCDAMNLNNPAVCVITTPGATAGPELCDDKDNNCDGIVDNPTGPDRVIDSMTHINFGGNNFYIDTYEASRPDAATTNNSTSRACSTANRPSWRNVTWTSAQAACQAAGKVLCTGPQWQSACEGSTNTTYPYGNTFNSTSCNTETYDGIPGLPDNDVMVNTGSIATCVSMPGVRDLSGNLKEWTDDITGVTTGGQNIAVFRGGSYETPKLGATCDFRTTRAAVNVIEASAGFRCCRATAP
ncbi:MAG: SUMF1/EgtB/PvdO family nonheme iron enzyme [Deltaproteobacteria bacterium]|nr:SUMF1/EgtB/PvdO family nonheme iron enzyme [Deltaproteobacteria bacterium]